MFSGVNNLEVYDVLASNAYDSDFSLTESELVELVPEDKIDGVRKWYNNMRVGKELLYNIYSVMSYLRKPDAGLIGYWPASPAGRSMTGGDGLLASLLNNTRAKIIACMLAGEQYRHSTTLDHQLNLEHLKNIAYCTDSSFYTLAVQAGYVSFEPACRAGGHVNASSYRVFIPNEEAKRVWARLFLNARYKDAVPKIAKLFDDLSDVEEFSAQLADFASMTLSYHDIIKDNIEALYHVFFFTLLYVLGYECKSNREAGLGRADILLWTPQYNAVLEFKIAESDADTALQEKCDEAIRQIDEKEYWHELRNSPLPVYKIGIACYGKKCLVKTVLHLRLPLCRTGAKSR
jgi:hypothetical protein